MFTETFSYNGAQITIRRADVRARLRAQLVYGTIIAANPNLSDEEWAEVEFFGRFLAQVSVEGELGFPLARVSDDADALMASKEALMASDDALYYDLVRAMRNVARNPGDPDLAPDVDEAKKTIPPSSESEASS